MGNQAVQKQIISQVLEESEKITCLNKTESAWHETNLFGTKEEGPIVVKQLLKIKSDDKFAKLQAQLGLMQSEIDSVRHHPNVMPYYKQSPVQIQQGVKDVTLLLRQYVCYNLSEKLIHIPQLLTMIEKKWLIFQLMCSLEQIHSVPGLTHGDIKPDNILVTSYDWLYLADLHPYKPIVVMDDNLKRYNKYFGYLDNNIRCYLAPERWLTPPQTLNSSQTKMAPSMDIFSAGCVIAEIFSDGEPLFDLPRLQSYRRGGLDLRDELAKRIEDPKIQSLVAKMLAWEPSERPTASQCLAEWCEQVFPSTFKSVFFHIGSAFQRLAYLYSDNRIALIRYHVDAIFAKCFKIENAVVELKFVEPMEPSMYRLCKDDETIQRFQQLVPTQFSFMVDNTEEEEAKDSMSEEERTEQNRDSALMVVHWIGQLYTTCFYPQMRIVALEMLQKIATFLPFDQVLGHVLPYIGRVYDTEATGQSQARVRVKAFEVLLSIFDTLIERTDMILIEPFDFKVFQNYIMPIVKKLMDQGKQDKSIRHAVAYNLAKLARVGTRLIEVAQSSAIRMRQEIRDKRESMRKDGIRDSIDTSKLGDNISVKQSFMRRRTMASGLMSGPINNLQAMTQQHQQDAVLEDIVVPNFDQELASLWSEIQRFIESFSGEEHDSNSLIAMLANLTELSQIFGAEKGDFLLQQCISPINRSDYQVKVQVLKTLSSLCLRIGQQKVTANVLPLTEIVLQDPEDLVVIQTIKMLTQFVKLRLIDKQHCLKTLEVLLPLLLYPNRQIRIQVGTFICTLANPAREQLPVEEAKDARTQRRIVVNKAPLFSQEEFFCFVRPKLLIYSIDQSDEMMELNKAQDLLKKLRPPLTLGTMRKYFKELTAAKGDVSDKVAANREAAFQKNDEMSDSDTFAFAFLSEYFKERLRKVNTFQKQQQQQAISTNSKYHSSPGSQDKDFQLQRQSRQRGKVYRCMKASAVAWLTKIEMLEAVKRSAKTGDDKLALTKNQKAQFVREFQDNVTVLFDPQTEIPVSSYSSENFGLNSGAARSGSTNDIQDPASFITPETHKILQALNQVPMIAHADTLDYIVKARNGSSGVTQGLRINSEISLTAQAAQPSLVAHFDAKDQKQSFILSEDQQREFKAQARKQQATVRPQGLLVTTLYEHRNPVNTITVTDDQRFFLTGSREDRSVHVWKVQNIEEDVTSRSAHSFSTQSSYINQVQTISRTKSVAVAGSGGVQIHDLERSMQYLSQNAITVEGQSSPRSSRGRRHAEESITEIKLDDSTDEVTRCLNFLTPNSYGSHLLCASTQKGAFFMHDLRAKNHVQFQNDLIGCQRGAVTTMCMGQDPYTLTMGTLGGFVLVYDIRYSIISAMYSHNMHYPIMAMATYQKGGDKSPPLALVSAGGPQHELSALNLESGLVETLFRCATPSSDRDLSKTDCPIVPEYIRETNFKDSKFGTVRRETTLKQFSRQLHAVKNHGVFSDIQQAIQSKLIKNIDSQLMDVSTRQRFKLLHDACKSPNVCRSILVPQTRTSRLARDSTTSQYAITGGNDMKIRYWSLNDSSKLSFQINTPRDDEVTYMSERLRDTTLIQERTLVQKELAPMSAQKLVDSASTAQSTYYQKQGANQFVKFAENTAYHNALASTWNKQVMADQQNRQYTASQETQNLMQRFQYEKGDGNSVIVQNMNGVSAGQLMNNLGIMTNGQDFVAAGQPGFIGGVIGGVSSAVAGPGAATGYIDLIKEQTTRNSEIVAHADTILDMALVDYRGHDSQSQAPLLVSCSRDSTVKVWRC